MFVGDWTGRGAAHWPERIAVVDVARGERFTYRDLDARANAVAGWLRERGVTQGVRVGILSRNGVEVLDTLFACAKLGAVLVPFNWRLPPAELAPLLAFTAPHVLVHDDTPCDFDGVRLAVGPAFEAVATQRRPAIQREQVDAEDDLCLLFTGGTTGRAKAARLSYRMVAWNTLNTLCHEVRAGDVTITHTPMFHTGGLMVYTLPLLSSGGRVVIMARWDAATCLELLDREQVTVFFAVPTQYQQLAETPGFASAKLGSLRFLTSGGAPLPVPLLRRWQAAHPVPFKQGFGMTEAGPGLFSMQPEQAVAKAGSIGQPNQFVDVRLAGDGDVGELEVRGPVLFSGYLGDAPQDQRAWFPTGDIARRDADGFYSIVDRKKDMFISGGENVYPAEIERVLGEHPAVALCAVVGVPDPQWGESGCAFVVPAAPVRPEELTEFLRLRLARYKVPKRFEIVDALPLSPAGKILRRELRERVRP